MTAVTIEHLFVTHQHRVLGLARTYGGYGIDPEDIAQEAWLRVLLSDFRGDCVPWQWLARVTRTAFISLLRRRACTKRGTEVQVPDSFDVAGEAASPEALAMTREELAGLLTCLRTLPRDLRDAVIAVDLLEDTPAAYAKRIGLSDLACRQRLWRARTKLRAEFHHHERTQRS